MSRSASISMVVFVGLGVFCAFLILRTRQDAAALKTLRIREQATRGEYEQAIDDITAIEDSLSAITERGQGLRASSLAAERRLSPTRGDEALAKVSELRAGIERARERIGDLEARLRTSGGRNAGLERLVDRLKTGLVGKEQMVAQLSSRVDSLRRHVSGLTAQVADQQASLEEQRRELGTVRFRIGSRRELLKSGVVIARGGVLGIGKTLDPAGQADESSYQILDTDHESVLPIGSERARVLTAQPVDSYRLERVNGLLELRILDPHAFRKVRTLVIVTA
jgi:polyhydroxyalkanoate synthesis regulator phasin